MSGLGSLSQPPTEVSYFVPAPAPASLPACPRLSNHPPKRLHPTGTRSNVTSARAPAQSLPLRGSMASPKGPYASGPSVTAGCVCPKTRPVRSVYSTVRCSTGIEHVCRCAEPQRLPDRQSKLPQVSRVQPSNRVRCAPFRASCEYLANGIGSSSQDARSTGGQPRQSPASFTL